MAQIPLENTGASVEQHTLILGRRILTNARSFADVGCELCFRPDHGTVSLLEEVPSFLSIGDPRTWLDRHGARSLETLSGKLSKELHKVSRRVGKAGRDERLEISSQDKVRQQAWLSRLSQDWIMSGIGGR